MNNIPKPYCNPYSLALKAYQDTRETQITKGYEKYGTQLHPSNHSSEELFNHAFEELVDLTHYIAAYHYKMHHLKERLLLASQETDPEAIQVHIALALKQIGDTV